MIIIKTKEIPEINKTFYKKIKCFCDRCSVEIKKGELYLEVNYSNNRYSDDLLYKQFCKECMKDGMYEMFMNEYYTNFSKCEFYKYPEWQEYDKWDAYCLGYKNESELENIEESEEKI